MLIQCWATVCDAGPTLNQHMLNVSCVLGYNVAAEINKLGLLLPDGREMKSI